MEDSKYLTIALMAFLGGILNGIAGWADSHEPFDLRKFLKTVITALLSGLVIGINYQFADGVTWKDILAAIVLGAGIDSFTNRIIGSLRRPK